MRHPNSGDWPQILALAEAMHRESWFADFDFSVAKVEQVFQACLERPDWLALVAPNKDGELVGFFAACTVEHFFGHDLYACDLVNYVRPEYRNGLTARRFLDVYEKWCVIRNVREIHVGVSTGRNVDKIQKFYERLGFGNPVVGLRKKCVAR